MNLIIQDCPKSFRTEHRKIVDELSLCFSDIILPDSCEKSDLFDLDSHIIEPGVGCLVFLVWGLLVELEGLDLWWDAVNLPLHTPTKKTSYTKQKHTFYLCPSDISLNFSVNLVFNWFSKSLKSSVTSSKGMCFVTQKPDIANYLVHLLAVVHDDLVLFLLDLLGGNLVRNLAALGIVLNCPQNVTRARYLEVLIFSGWRLCWQIKPVDWCPGHRKQFWGECSLRRVARWWRTYFRSCRRSRRRQRSRRCHFFETFCLFSCCPQHEPHSILRLNMMVVSLKDSSSRNKYLGTFVL